MKSKNTISSPARALYFVVLLALMVGFGMTAHAAVHDVSGFAWASNFGWISADDANANLSYDDNNNTLNGYVWNGVQQGGLTGGLGWVRFANWDGMVSPDNDCPNDGPGNNCRPRVDGTDMGAGGGARVVGWARACSVYASNCDGILANNSYRGGWDGWISLNCQNENNCSGAEYGWEVDVMGDLSGYAWGGNPIGWMQSFNMNIGAQPPLPAPVVDIKALKNNDATTMTDTTLQFGQTDSVQISIDLDSADNSVTCVETAHSAMTKTLNPYASGNSITDDRTTVTAKPSPTASPVTWTYSVTCTDSAGKTDTDTVDVQVYPVPTVTLDMRKVDDSDAWTTVSPYIMTDNSDELKIRWDSTYADACYGQTNGSVSGLNVSGTSNTDADLTEPPINFSGTFEVRCTGIGGDSGWQVFEVQNPAPAAEVWTLPTLTDIGADIEIHWDITGRTPSNCSIEGPGFGSPYVLTTNTGDVTVAIQGESTYTLSCVAEGITPDSDDEATVRVTGIIIES